MKTTNYYIKSLVIALLSLTALTACDEDGDKIYLSELKPNKLIATESDVVLTQDQSEQQVLSLAWSTEALTVSNPEMSAPNILTTYMQISLSSDFTSDVVESLEKSLSKVYTGSELNTVAKNLGIEPDVSTALYFRLKSSTGNNMDPVYSNVISIHVTSYKIDMSVAFILDSKKENTGGTLYSPTSNGIYSGFMGATSWYNFFVKEGDGTVWGNPADGDAFLLSSEESSWNCWFPGLGGCYYTNVNTVSKQWSALFLPSLTVSGDISGEMTFDRPNVKWTFTFNAASATSYKIKLNTTGKQYNYATGTDDDAAVNTPVAFARDNGKIVLTQQASEITVSAPADGECTLILDLSDPKAWKCEIQSGSSGPVVVEPYLYLPGIDDGTSGNWTFDNYLTNYDEDNLAYAGVINVNSLWGYSFNTEKDNWEDKYTLEEGDAYAGKLAFKGADNIPAPTAGLYLIEASLKALTYNLTNVGDKIYVSGLNDVWEFNTVLNETQTKGVYSGTITINSASSWGFQIHLDTSWNHYYGGSNGKLYYKGSNITDDATLSPGTHQMTVDLIKGTYEIN